MVPTLLIAILNISHAANERSGSLLNFGSREPDGLLRWALTVLPAWYETLLRWMSPFFAGPSASSRSALTWAVFEGFCTLLVAQSFGQVSRHYAARSETWQVGSLLVSASIYVLSLGVLISTYAESAREPIHATLIGASVTALLFLSGLSFLTTASRFVLEASLMVRRCCPRERIAEPRSLPMSSSTSSCWPPIPTRSTSSARCSPRSLHRCRRHCCARSASCRRFSASRSTSSRPRRRRCRRRS